MLLPWKPTLGQSDRRKATFKVEGLSFHDITLIRCALGQTFGVHPAVVYSRDGQARGKALQAIFKEASYAEAD